MKATISPRRMFGSGLLVLVLAGILGTAMWVWQDLRFELWNRGERDLEGLQVFGTLPDFSFIERSGRTVTLADLRGKVWIANFISDDEEARRRLRRDTRALLRESRS